MGRLTIPGLSVGAVAAFPLIVSEWLAADPPASLLLNSGESKLHAAIIRWADENSYARLRSEGRYEIWRRTRSASAEIDTRRKISHISAHR